MKNISHIEEPIRMATTGDDGDGQTVANFPNGNAVVITPLAMVAGGRFVVRGHLIDNKGCRSADGNYTINGGLQFYL